MFVINLAVLIQMRPVRASGLKNRPAPFPWRMSYKATKPGYFCFIS